MRPILFLFSFIIFLASCSEDSPPNNNTPPQTITPILGADLSFQGAIRQTSYTYKDSSGQPVDLFSFFKSNNWNTVRFRLWVNPADGNSSLAEVKTLSEQARLSGLNIWLCIHFSDTWADPGNQETPLAWRNLSITELGDSVESYVNRVCQSIQPEIIQIGNEVNPGFMWPQGHIDSLDNFLFLLQKASLSAHNACPDARRMIHLAGFDPTVFWTFNQIEQYGIEYEMAGLSYYPSWHGKDLTELAFKLNHLQELTGKEVGIAETAYPFTLLWNDWTNNVVGDSTALIPEFDATPQGQQAFLQSIKNITDSINNCWGMAYWAPDWTAYRSSTSTEGSAWENLALFDFDGHALPAFYLD